MILAASRPSVVLLSRPWAGLFVRLPRPIVKSLTVSLGLSVAGLSTYSAQAVDIFKASNTTAIDNTGSWFTTTGGPTNVGAIATSDVGVFDNTVTGAITTANLGANFTIGAFRMTNPVGNVTVGVGAAASATTLTLNNASTYAIDMSAATADLTIGSVANGGNLRWASANFGGMTVATGRTLTINSNFTNQGNNKTIDLNGLGNIVFNAAAGGGVAMGFRITGGANVTMNGAGFWGGTSSKEIIKGTLNIGNDSALGTVTLNMGGTSADTPTITASGGARAIANDVTLLATSVAGNPTVAGANALTINGAVTSSGALRTLSVNNSALTTLGGSVFLSNDNTTGGRGLTINGTGDTTVSGVIASNNAGNTLAAALSYGGSGTLALSNANTFTGTLTQSSGTVRLNNSLAAQFATVSIGTNGGVTFGTGIAAATFGGLSGSANLALTNTDTSNVALKIGNNNAATTYNGQLSGGGSIEKFGTATTTLTNTSSHTGGTTITGGTLALNSSGANVNSGHLGSNTVTLANGATLAFAGNGNSSDTLTLGNALSVNSGATATINFGERSVLNGNVSGDSTTTLKLVAGTIDRNDIGGNWSGFNGTLVFNDTNSTVREMELTNVGGTFNTTSLVNATVDIQEARLRLTANSGGNTVQIGALAGSASGILGGGSSGGSVTWEIGAKNLDTDFAGVIQDGSAATKLTKVGTGSQTLSGSNTYTGATTIGTSAAGAANITNSTANGGTLVAGAVGALGSGATGTASITVHNGGTLLINNTSGSSTDHVRNDAGISLGTTGGTGVGGTIKIAGGAAEGSDAAAGLGALTLSSSSTLDFDSLTSGNLLSFATGFAPGSFTLNIINWSNATFNSSTNTPGGAADDRLIFNQDLETVGLLSSISFGGGFTTTQVSLGGGLFEIGGMTPVPEPATWMAAASLLGLVGFRGTRRSRRS